MTIDEMKKLFILVLTVVIMTACFVGCEETSETDIKQKTNEDIRIWIDKETGVHYVIYAESWGHSGGAGITPRLNQDGTLYTTSECEEET